MQQNFYLPKLIWIINLIIINLISDIEILYNYFRLTNQKFLKASKIFSIEPPRETETASSFIILLVPI